MVMAKLAIAMAKLAMERSVSVVAFEVSSKLREIGGEGPWKVRLDRIVDALKFNREGWSGETARNRIRHLIKFDQKPTPEQFLDVIRAHADWCAEKLKARRDDTEDARLRASIARSRELAGRADAAHYRSRLDVAGDLLVRRRQFDAQAAAESQGAAGS
jgi:hypothetical protein